MTEGQSAAERAVIIREQGRHTYFGLNQSPEVIALYCDGYERGYAAAQASGLVLSREEAEIVLYLVDGWNKSKDWSPEEKVIRSALRARIAALFTQSAEPAPSGPDHHRNRPGSSTP